MSAPKFFGRHERSLDPKGRIVLPAKFRANFDAQAFLTQYTDGCLALWTPDDFHEHLDLLARQQDQSADLRNLARVWAGGSQDVEIDRQGRFPIPPYLQEYAGLDGSVLVMGALERVELWNPQRWAQRVQPSEQRLADGFAGASEPRPAQTTPA